VKKVFSILFVCSGNTCRSPMAEAVMRAELEARGLDRVKVASAGLTADGTSATTASALAALGRMGVKARSRRSRLLAEDDLARADLVLTMTDLQKQQIVLEHPWALAKTFVMPEFSGSRRPEISDPIGGSEREYLDCALALRAEARKMVPGIRRILQKRRSER
jgi:protein-tyrosine-phosphatase